MTTTAKTFSPSRTEKWFVFLVLCHLIIQAIFPNIEKRFYWGELFAVATFFFVLRFQFNGKGYDRHLLFLVLIWAFLFPVYGTIISKVFWADVFEPIFLIRHSVFFTYCAFFFFAYKYADLLLKYLHRIAIVLLVTTSLFIFKDHYVSVNAIFGIALMACSLRFPEKKRLYLFILALIFCILFRGTDGGTNKVLISFFLGFCALNYCAPFWTKFVSPSTRRAVIYLLMMGAAALSIYLLSQLYEMTTQMALLGGESSSLDSMAKRFHTDLNGFWRPILWSHLYGRLLQHPWGVGLGTPLFEPWLDGFVMLHLDKFEENYVQGAHNGFVTFFARLGLPCIILFTFLFYYSAKLAKQVFSHLQYQPLRTQEGRLLTGCFLGFIFMVIVISFSVTLESPLFAGIFWFSFGLFVRLFGDAAAKNELDVRQELHIEETHHGS